MRYFLWILLTVYFLACKDNSSDSTLTIRKYTTNDEVWGYGPALLAAPNDRAQVIMQRLTDANNLDSDDSYKLLVSTPSQDGSTERTEPLYVDKYDEDTRQLLIYEHTVEYSPRAGRPNVIDAYFVLKHESPTYPAVKRIPIATAEFRTSANIATARFLNLSPSGLPARLSYVKSAGDFSGRWAIHYLDVDYPSRKNEWCRLAVELPDAAETQEEREQCRAKPPTDDICKSNPFTPGCLPNGPTLVSDSDEFSGVVDVGFLVAPRVYRVDVVSGRAEVAFVSQKIASEIDTNAEICNKQFYALGRTIGGRINDSCLVELLPSADPTNGKATCRVEVSFNAPQTYLDRVCNVTGVFVTGNGLDFDSAQILSGIE